MRNSRLGAFKNPARWQFSLWITAYTAILLLVQVLFVSTLPIRALRVDLLLPLMLGIATECPPVFSLLWAFLWGFVADTLSGKFWGFHVGSYVATICLVYIGAERFEFRNVLYQMFFVGLCALGQSIVLGLFMFIDPGSSAGFITSWMDLILRSLFMMVLSPVITAPVWQGRRSSI